MVVEHGGGRRVAARLVDLNTYESDADINRPNLTVFNESEAGVRQQMLSDGRYYYRGRRYPELASGPDVEVEETIRLPQQITRNRIVQLLSAMMNMGRGGTVHYGVGAEGRVFGLSVSQQSRDALRTGLDEALTCLVPPITPECYRLTFVPVFVRGQVPSSYKPSEHCLFVISAICQSTDDVYLIRRDDCAYGRYPQSGGDESRHVVARLSLPQLRHLVAKRHLYESRLAQVALQSAAAGLRAAARAPCEQCGLPRGEEAEAREGGRTEERARGGVRKTVISTTGPRYWCSGSDSESDGGQLEIVP